MSKLSFRARALDASKPMPVLRTSEVPDLPDFAAINRAVPLMPTGMEKEEECEHHLQRAISAQQAFGHTGHDHVIPTPEVFETSEKDYDTLYGPNFKMPRQPIHMQLLAMEQDIPDYDMDSEDEEWLNQQSQHIELNQIKFEEMLDRLEKSSGQHVVTLKEAKLLLKEDDDLIIAVYDYWLNKRLKTEQPLIPVVRTEKRDGSTSNNPYVAFRRRTEKMQTRKNRKNDETSYEKMLKLRRDLSRAVNIFDFIKYREKTKQDLLKITIDIFEKRYQIGDFSGQIMNEVSQIRHIRPSFMPLNNVHQARFNERGVGRPRNEDLSIQAKRKREYRRRQKMTDANTGVRHDAHHEPNEYNFSSDEEGADLASDQEEQEDDPDGAFAFKRKKGCMYHAPLTDRLGNWSWCSPQEGGLGDKRYRFCLTSIAKPKPRCIGYSRRRVGRGGRIVFDRAFTPLDNKWNELDDVSSSSSSASNDSPLDSHENELLDEIKHDDWLHFRPRTPPQELVNPLCSPDCEDAIEYDEEGNVIPIVAITSLKEYFEPDILFPSGSLNTEIDLATFEHHKEELIEMQRKQLERLKSDEVDDDSHFDGDEYGTAWSSGVNGECNSEHSSRIISCASSSKTTSSSTNTNSSSGHLLTSTLDDDKVNFAVSAVLSASEVSNIWNEMNDEDDGASNDSHLLSNNDMLKDNNKTRAKGKESLNNNSNGPVSDENNLSMASLITPSNELTLSVKKMKNDSQLSQMLDNNVHDIGMMSNSNASMTTITNTNITSSLVNNKLSMKLQTRSQTTNNSNDMSSTTSSTHQHKQSLPADVL